MRRSLNLVWIDLEMTGLEPDRHVILEIASLVTSPDLEVLAEGPSLALRRDDGELARIDEWSKRTHEASGLMERVRNSAVTAAEAERRTLAFLREWVPEGASPLCGNSIAHDRRFLRREMPALDAFMHYRQIDVSTIKELVRRWYPDRQHAPAKRQTHLALDDIRESVEELRWYREHVFVQPERASETPPD